jgi:SAM-dependent methyltransferase
MAVPGKEVSVVHRILNQTWSYSLVLQVSGAGEGRREFFRTHAHIPAGSRVLEIGCGHGKNIEYLPASIAYTGCDYNPRYIEHARQTYGTRGRFLCLSAEDLVQQSLGEFDVALVVSVLHHLNDEQVRALAAGALASLRPGGVLLVWEPCWTPSQGRLDRLMLSLDRGRFVRTADEYSTLLGGTFGHVETRFLMTPKMLWPQSGCILTARTPADNPSAPARVPGGR